MRLSYSNHVRLTNYFIWNYVRDLNFQEKRGLIEVSTKNSTNEMSKLEFNSICRLCVQILEKEKVSPIFNNESYTDKISLPERIKYCSSVEVAENDGLPPQICNSCLSKLNQSFVFRNQCVLADLTLKQLKHVTFSLSEIPNLLNVDIENQIIKSTSDACLTVQSLLTSKSVKNEKEKEELLEEVKSSNSQPEGGSSDVNSSNQKKTYTKKEKSKRKERSSQGKTKKLRILKSKKDVDGVEPNKETEIENFTIEPDLFNFNEWKEDEKNVSEPNFEEFTKKPVKKIVKSLAKKKGKTKKMTGAKEKPSSYTCDYCQKVYPSEGGWRYHIHTMHNENYQPFICDLCGQAFKVKKNLEGHKNSIHFHLKLHLCDLCGRGFASKYALKVHKIWHNDEKNFTCDICGTKFRTRGKMNTHRSIHGGPKKFMCHICSRDFRWKKDFEIHMRTHTGEKPFKCSHCGKAFASLTNMKKHERNHLGKTETGKNFEGFDMMVPTSDERLYRSEFMDFGYETEDVRNRQETQI